MELRLYIKSHRKVTYPSRGADFPPGPHPLLIIEECAAGLLYPCVSFAGCGYTAGIKDRIEELYQSNSVDNNKI